ncbi:hypothetical protein RFI_04358, partial [Reticulomyxa filosa]
MNERQDMKSNKETEAEAKAEKQREKKAMEVHDERTDTLDGMSNTITVQDIKHAVDKPIDHDDYHSSLHANTIQVSHPKETYVSHLSDIRYSDGGLPTSIQSQSQSQSQVQAQAQAQTQMHAQLQPQFQSLMFTHSQAHAIANDNAQSLFPLSIRTQAVNVEAGTANTLIQKSIVPNATSQSNHDLVEIDPRLTGDFFFFFFFLKKKEKSCICKQQKKKVFRIMCCQAMNQMCCMWAIFNGGSMTMISRNYLSRTVTNVKIAADKVNGKSKGYGYVEFHVNDTEGCTHAKQTLQGYVLLDCPLVISFASPTKLGMPEYGNTNIPISEQRLQNAVNYNKQLNDIPLGDLTEDMSQQERRQMLAMCPPRHIVSPSELDMFNPGGMV